MEVPTSGVKSSSKPTDKQKEKNKPIFFLPLIRRKLFSRVKSLLQNQKSFNKYPSKNRRNREPFFTVTDGGNGYSCDWADWANPVLIDKNENTTKLTSLKWKSAKVDWGQVS